MKYVGQPLATKSAKPSPEGDYYAKYNTIQDAINDKIVRLYNITMKGVTPQQLKNSKTPEEFAELLKKRGYYGNNKYGTPQGNVEMKNYAAGLKAKLTKINIIEFVEKTVDVTKEKIAEIKDSKYLIYTIQNGKGVNAEFKICIFNRRMVDTGK
jgi:ribosomal protein S8